MATAGNSTTTAAALDISTSPPTTQLTVPAPSTADTATTAGAPSTPAVTTTTTEPPNSAAPTVFTTVSSGPNDATTLTITSTASPPATIVSVSTNPALASSSVLHPSSSGGSSSHGSSADSRGGLTGSTKVVVAVVVPIVGVALIAVGLLIFWKRRQRGREAEEARRKEVEEYGYNPNSSPNGGMGSGVAGSSNGEDAPYDMVENDSEGYRGWGSTNGGRKSSTNMGSSVGTAQPISPIGMAFSDGGHSQNGSANGYAGMATSPTASTFPAATAASTDGNNSNAPLMGSTRPATSDSSVIGAMAGPMASENGGVHRGISNASSNYSTMSHSDHSDAGIPASHHDPGYYGADGTYDDGYGYGRHQSYQQYPEGNGYGMTPPVIRDVQARRNTRIETPSSNHYPQQGNSGIAQNF